ncbi:MAG: ABC transporter ATP-binding protein [Planctomycetes bacterium]|nr:ABC transporter ATP-binding protein [Planctomycetota bacterium]MBI3846584.1 ABC transporter ATP-binding protein [Planctomycetota bacterium]
MIELRDLEVRFGKVQALAGLTLRVAGGAVGLLGPNGAGKTTLIKTLLGLVAPSRGSASVLGLDARRDPRRIRQLIGYMPERDCHIAGMNAVNFVAYAGELTGMRRTDAFSRAHEALFYVGLEEARYRNVDTYSTGMKQRIKLAQALVHGPKIVLLDEPTNGMDPKGRDEMLALVKDIATNKGIHVILSSHLLPDVETVCKHVVVLSRGKVLADDDIARLKAGAGDAFVVRVKGDAAPFLARLVGLGHAVTAATTSEGAHRVVLRNGDGSDLLFRTARESGVQIRHLIPETLSLEDVFMKALEEA